MTIIRNFNIQGWGEKENSFNTGCIEKTEKSGKSSKLKPLNA